MKYLSIFSIVLLSVSCINDDYFGKSNRAQIKTFVLQGQNGSATINHDELSIQVPVFDSIADFNLAATEITTSNFSTVFPAIGVTQNFTNPVEYTVTAEDGSKLIYTVSLTTTNVNPQLENSSYEDWYQESVGSKNFEQPGLDKATTLWATANRGLALGGADGNTSSEQKNPDSLYAKMETVAAPAIVRIAAATLFTGKFTEGFPSVSDPRSNLTLGVPFTGRPTAVKLQYKYKSGADNKDDKGNPLAYGDQCDIYILLENRDGAKTKRVGTAWFRNGDTKTDWTDINIAVKYGPLNASDPWFGYAQPQPNEEWGTGTESITHISVLYTSSFEGDIFYGAIGSVLEVDNLVLEY